MKRINAYIQEKLHINKDVKDPYNYHPKDKDELIECIKEKIDKEGLGTKDKPLDLNDIDTYEITDMRCLFDSDGGELKDLSKNGNFDISDWDVSNVEDMYSMFFNSNFNGDISNWDVSNVKNMDFMFRGSNFTGENSDINNWDVSNVEDFGWMFAHSVFNDNISGWNISKVANINDMFYNSPLQKNPPKWYKK